MFEISISYADTVPRTQPGNNKKLRETDGGAYSLHKSRSNITERDLSLNWAICLDILSHIDPPPTPGGRDGIKLGVPSQPIYIYIVLLLLPAMSGTIAASAKAITCRDRMLYTQQRREIIKLLLEVRTGTRSVRILQIRSAVNPSPPFLEKLQQAKWRIASAMVYAKEDRWRSARNIV